MTKTTKSVDGQKGLVEMTTTSVHTTVLGSLTTAEDMDLSSVVARVEEGSPPSLEIQADPVVGDDTKIISPATSFDPGDYTIYLYYTQGKETIGTDLVDPVTVIREIFKAKLPIQFHWSVGGEVGDEKFSTDPDNTYIQSVGTATPGEAGKKLVPVHIYTADVTPSTIA